MFSPFTPAMSAAARLAVPTQAMLSRSFAPRMRRALALVWRPPQATVPVAATADVLRNWRREALISLRRCRVLRQFADVNVLEPHRRAVRLQFDRAGLVKRLVFLPIIFQRRVAHHHLVIEFDAHLVAEHDDVEAVPLARQSVGAHERLGLSLLVVEQATGAALVLLASERVPDLHLRHAAQIEAAVALLLDAPVAEHFKVSVIARAHEVVEAVAAIDDGALLDLPILPHLRVGLGLLGGELLRRKRRALGRVVVWAHQQTLPAREVNAVEKRFETCWRRILASQRAADLACVRQLFEGEVA